MQDRGDVKHLVVWSGDCSCGHATIFPYSVYGVVQSVISDFPKMNGSPSTCEFTDEDLRSKTFGSLRPDLFGAL